MSTLKKTLKKLFPRGTRRGTQAKKMAIVLRLVSPIPFEPDYKRWIKYIEPERWSTVVKTNQEQPLFSIVIPFYNTPGKYLYPLLDSIRGQSFQSWELIMADASNDEESSEAIRKASQRDKRLKYYRVENNGGISANTNVALSKASGQYIVFSDHDDTLSAHALNEIAIKVLGDSAIDIVYTDEDKLSDNGKWRHSPFFKPDWSPHLFLNTNYTNHLSAIRRELVEGVDGLRPEFDGSQDYDLLLRIHRKFGPLNVCHIDKVLYHWREAAGSTAVHHNSKSYAFEAGRKALQEHIDSGEVEGMVVNIEQRPGFYNHKLTPKKIKSVAIYVAVSEQNTINQRFIDKLATLTDTSSLEVTFHIAKTDATDSELRKSSSTDAIFVFRQTALPCESDWLVRLSGALELPDVSKVAPRVLNADLGRVVDMGLVDDGEGNMIPLLKGLAASDQTYVGHAEWVRDVDQLSGAVEGYLTSQPARKSKHYNVVWSYVNFRQQHITRSSKFFNGNLYVFSKNNKVRINGEQ